MKDIQKKYESNPIYTYVSMNKQSGDDIIKEVKVPCKEKHRALPQEILSAWVHGYGYLTYS